MVLAQPMLATKLFAPRVRPELVTRDRLLTRLDAATQQPLTLISAPAGYGKTTLLGTWIATRDHEVAWVSLDVADNDPTRFWSYALAALQRIDVQLGVDAQVLLLSQQPLDVILTTLINDLVSAPERVSLILDDYHIIDNQAIHESLAFFLEHCPPQIHVLITSRSDPPLPLSRLRARGELSELRASDLRFTPAEAAQFLNQMMGLRLSEVDIAALEGRTEGWIAGLQLAALSLQGRPSEHIAEFIHSFAGSNRYVVDYLIQEVLERQSQDTLNFLLKTSILDRLYAGLCDAVVEQTGSQRMLEHLERTNLFLIPLDAERQWYRYHHLFADVLSSRLSHQQPDHVQRLHRRASDWFAEQSLIAEAIEHALRAKAFERAAGLIENQIEFMRKRAEHITLQSWLDKLPESVLHTRPRLCLARAHVLVVAHHLEQADRWMDLAEAAAHETQVDDRFSGELLITRLRCAQRRNQTERVGELAEQAVQQLPLNDIELRGIAYVFLGVAYYYTDRDAECEPAMAEATRLCLAAGDISTALGSMANEGSLQEVRGQLRRSLETYQRALELANEHKMAQFPVASRVHGYMANVLYELNDQEAMESAVQIAIELSDRGTDPHQRAVNRSLLGRLYMAQGDLDAAHDKIEEALRIVAERQVPHDSVPEVFSVRLRLWLAQGQITQAAAWLHQRAFDVDGPLDSGQRPLYHLLPSLYLTLGEMDEAERWLAHLRSTYESNDRLPGLILVFALEALLWQARGDMRKALSMLQKALDLAEPEAYVRTFVDLGEPMQALLIDVRATLGDPKLRAYVDKLLDAFGVVMQESVPQFARGATSLIETPTERELEVLRLVAQGMSDRQVAERLVVTTGTVKRHLNNLYGKLGVHSRTQALARAQELGLL